MVLKPSCVTLHENNNLSHCLRLKSQQTWIKWALPLQQVLGLFPLGDLSSTVVVVLLPRGANVLCPVICWVLVTRKIESQIVKKKKKKTLHPKFVLLSLYKNFPNNIAKVMQLLYAWSFFIIFFLLLLLWPFTSKSKYLMFSQSNKEVTPS